MLSIGIPPIADATLRSVGRLFPPLDYGYQKSQCLCGVSDFKVRTKFLIGHHEIPKRYETFSRKEGAYTGFLGEEVYRAITRSVPMHWQTRYTHRDGLLEIPVTAAFARMMAFRRLVVWQLRLHTSHIGEQPEGKHRLRILREWYSGCQCAE